MAGVAMPDQRHRDAAQIELEARLGVERAGAGIGDVAHHGDAGLAGTGDDLGEIVDQVGLVVADIEDGGREPGELCSSSQSTAPAERVATTLPSSNTSPLIRMAAGAGLAGDLGRDGGQQLGAALIGRMQIGQDDQACGRRDGLGESRVAEER